MLKWLRSLRWSIRGKLPMFVFRVAKWFDDKFIDKEKRLIFAAYKRCACGAGLAYDPCAWPAVGEWDCSDILLGRAIPSGQPGAKTHDDTYPFSFWEIMPEESPRAGGATTRMRK